MQVDGRLALQGVAAGEWWDTSPSMTWALVFAGAGQLLHPHPTDAQRPLNRRVIFLVSPFPRV